MKRIKKYEAFVFNDDFMNIGKSDKSDFNYDDFDPDLIANNIYQFCQEWPEALWKTKLDLIGVTDNKPSLQQIINGVNNLIDEAKGSKIKKLLSYYDSILKSGHLHIKLEEVEDLFLDIPEYTIQKNNRYDSSEIFNILVNIKNVDEKDLQYINNHIYGSVKKRLPDSLYIKRVTVLMDDDGRYDIKIRLFENKPISKRLEDSFINAITNAFRNLRDAQPEDDPDYEG